MAGCNHNTSSSPQLSYTEGKDRSRLKLTIQICFYAVGTQNQSSIQGKIRGFSPGIICNDNAASHRLRAGLFDIIGQPLGSLGNSVFIYSIGACSDYPSKAPCAKLQILIKPVLDFLFIAFQLDQFLFSLFVNKRALQPHSIFFSIVHKNPFLVEFPKIFCNDIIIPLNESQESGLIRYN